MRKTFQSKQNHTNKNQNELQQAIQFVQESLNKKYPDYIYKYTFIINQLESQSIPRIKYWLQALNHCTTFIQPIYYQLLETIYQIQLPEDDEIYDIYSELLLNLVTSHPMYLENVLNCLYKRICSNNQHRFALFKTLFGKIQSLIPLSSKILIETIHKNIPNRWKSNDNFICYIDFFIDTFGDEIEIVKSMFYGIIERILVFEMDNQRKKGILECEEIDEVIIDYSKDFNQKLKEEEKDDVENIMNFDVKESMDKQNEIDENEQILNELIQYSFQFIKRMEILFPMNTNKIITLTEFLYEIVFDHYIIRTQFTYYSSLIYFNYCQSTERSLSFLEFLFNQFSKESNSLQKKYLYICHIGSFLSHCKLLSSITIMSYLQQLFHQFIQLNEINQLNENQSNKMKILICQQMFSIFIYRFNEIQIRNDLSTLFEKDGIFTTIIVDQCNPLSNCKKETVDRMISICKDQLNINLHQVFLNYWKFDKPLFVSLSFVDYDPYRLPKNWIPHFIKNYICFPIKKEDEDHFEFYEL